MENVTKLVQDRYGSRNIQEKNTTTYEKPVKNVTILLQSRHGLRNTQEMNKLTRMISRKPHQKTSFK